MDLDINTIISHLHYLGFNNVICRRDNNTIDVLRCDFVYSLSNRSFSNYLEFKSDTKLIGDILDEIIYKFISMIDPNKGTMIIDRVDVELIDGYVVINIYYGWRNAY